jgi:hypothetical protein
MSTNGVSSAFLLTLDENLREVFGSYCSSHEDPNFSFCFEFAAKLISYKNAVQFVERKEVGYQIMEMIEHSPAKVFT